MSRKKVELKDIQGLVHTDEPTDSVELKKEAYNPKLFNLNDEGKVVALGLELSNKEVVTLLNNFNHENNMMNFRLKLVEKPLWSTRELERLQAMEKILKRYFKTYVGLGYPLDFSSRDKSSRDKYIEGYLKGQRDMMKELKAEIDKL